MTESIYSVIRQLVFRVVGAVVLRAIHHRTMSAPLLTWVVGIQWVDSLIKLHSTIWVRRRVRSIASTSVLAQVEIQRRMLL